MRVERNGLVRSDDERFNIYGLSGRGLIQLLASLRQDEETTDELAELEQKLAEILGPPKLEVGDRVKFTARGPDSAITGYLLGYHGDGDLLVGLAGPVGWLIDTTVIDGLEDPLAAYRVMVANSLPRAWWGAPDNVVPA